MLNNVPPVVYFYGLAGAGKNFAGDILARLTGRPVYHADEDMTAEMRLAIAEKRSFTPEMRDRYFVIVAKRINELRRIHGNSGLVATQATYKAQHRAYLAAKVPEIDMVLVTADDENILERLRRRGDDVTSAYAAIIKNNFEPPPAGSKTIVNNEDEAEIIRQFENLYGG